jgi:hypothetical protein
MTSHHDKYCDTGWEACWNMTAAVASGEFKSGIQIRTSFRRVCNGSTDTPTSPGETNFIFDESLMPTPQPTMKPTRKPSLPTSSTPTPFCTLIAAYNTNETLGAVCELTNKLRTTLQDGEADVSAIDVGGVCVPKPNKICPPKRKNRRLVSSDAIATSPSSPTPVPGYIVFTAIADELNCTEIAAKLRGTQGVLSVNVDVGGSTELGLVSVRFDLNHVLTRIHLHLTQTATKTVNLTSRCYVNKISLPFCQPTLSVSALCRLIKHSLNTLQLNALPTVALKPRQGSHPSLGEST